MTTRDKKSTPVKGATRINKNGVRQRFDGAKWVKTTRQPGSNPAAAVQTAPAPALPALTADEFARFSDIRQDVSNMYEGALTSYNEQMAALGQAADQFNNRTDRAGFSAGLGLREQLSDSGLGFSPMFLNKGMRSLAGQVADAKAEARGERSARESALGRMLSDAENARTQTISRLDRDMALTRSAGLVDMAGNPLTPTMPVTTPTLGKVAKKAKKPAAKVARRPGLPAMQPNKNVRRPASNATVNPFPASRPGSGLIGAR
jgi:hypothetical protein